MGTLLGFVAGLGLMLIASSIWPAGNAESTRARARALPGTDLLSRAGVTSIDAARLWTISAGLALGATAALWVVTDAAGLALTIGALAGFLPVTLLKGRALRRRRDFAAAWPDAIDNLSSAVRAGLSLPEALAGLAERGPLELRESFAAFGRDYRASGQFAAALDRLKRRLSDPTGDRVVEALRLARDVGGSDLGRMFRHLSSFLRDDLRVRSELEARQSWTVVAAKVAVAAPWLVLALMSFQEGVIERFAQPLGILILAVGALGCVVAYGLMLRLGRLPEEPRVLR